MHPDVIDVSDLLVLDPGGVYLLVSYIDDSSKFICLPCICVRGEHASFFDDGIEDEYALVAIFLVSVCEVMIDVNCPVAHNCAAKCVLGKGDADFLAGVHELDILVAFLPCLHIISSHLCCKCERSIHSVFPLRMFDEKRGDWRMMRDVLGEDLGSFAEVPLECFTKDRVKWF